MLFNSYDVFSFEKDYSLIHQNLSLNSHNPIKNPSSKLPIYLSLYLLGKPWSILGSLLFLQYMLMICLKLTYFFIYKWLLFTLPAHNVKGKNLNEKIIISLLITPYTQTESEIEEGTAKQPWLLYCYQLLLSMFCRIIILSWASTLQRKPSVLSNTPSWNRITGLDAKWRCLR